LNVQHVYFQSNQSVSIFCRHWGPNFVVVTFSPPFQNKLIFFSPKFSLLITIFFWVLKKVGQFSDKHLFHPQRQFRAFLLGQLDNRSKKQNSFFSSKNWNCGPLLKRQFFDKLFWTDFIWYLFWFRYKTECLNFIRWKGCIPYM
jgi:hypothetical protein